MEYITYKIISVKPTAHYNERAVVSVEFRQFGATLRTILMSFIPGIKFARCEFKKNNTVFQNEHLEQRIRCIPVIQSSVQNGEMYYLKVAIPKSADRSLKKILSQDIVDSRGRSAPVTKNLPIMEIGTGQEVDVEIFTGSNIAAADGAYQFAIKPDFSPEKMTVTFETTDAYSAETLLEIAIVEIKKFVGRVADMIKEDKARIEYNKKSKRTEMTFDNIPITITQLIISIGQESEYLTAAWQPHPLVNESKILVYDTIDKSKNLILEICSWFFEEQ